MAGRRDALEAGLAALRRKERTSGELADLLRARGHDEDEVEAAIASLLEAGELDDERFARRYAEDKRDLRGWGRERIREALAARGLPAEPIENALGPPSHAVEVERASALLRGRGEQLTSDAARARALGYLTRRGYDYEAAYEAVRAAAGAA